MKNREVSTYKFFDRRTERELEETFEAYWEVSLAPISGDYTVAEISCIDLLDIWVRDARSKHPNNLIPIDWFIQGKDSQVKIYEFMPSQYQHSPHQSFLTHYTHPINSKTGEPLNWLTIPVVDKLWNSKRQDKGGFIQQATGWKPSPLQPYVYLPSLTEVLVH